MNEKKKVDYKIKVYTTKILLSILFFFWF